MVGELPLLLKCITLRWKKVDFAVMCISAGVWLFSSLMTCRVSLLGMVRNSTRWAELLLAEMGCFEDALWTQTVWLSVDSTMLWNFFLNTPTWLSWEHLSSIFEIHPSLKRGSPHSPQYPALHRSSSNVGKGHIFGAPGSQRWWVLSTLIPWPWDGRDEEVRGSSSFTVGTRNKSLFCFPL